MNFVIILSFVFGVLTSFPNFGIFFYILSYYIPEYINRDIYMITAITCQLMWIFYFFILRNPN